MKYLVVGYDNLTQAISNYEIEAKDKEQLIIKFSEQSCDDVILNIIELE